MLVNNEKFNAVPIIVQQMVQTMMDPNTPTQLKFNQYHMISLIAAYCQAAIAQYEKAQKTQPRRERVK